MLHQPWARRGGACTASDMRIEAEELLRPRGEVDGLLAARAQRMRAEVDADTERDRWLPAEDARA